MLDVSIGFSLAAKYAVVIWTLQICLPQQGLKSETFSVTFSKYWLNEPPQVISLLGSPCCLVCKPK